jgi:hypothetical protein
MAYVISTWTLVVGFMIAGLANAIGTNMTRSNFARWGFPAWWGRVTGGLELLAAVLIAVPLSRSVGLGLAFAIIATASLTVTRYRDFKHLLPLSGFAAAMALNAMHQTMTAVERRRVS